MGCGRGWGGVDERVEVRCGGGVNDGRRSVAGGSLGEGSVVALDCLLLDIFFEMLTIVGFGALKHMQITSLLILDEN